MGRLVRAVKPKGERFILHTRDGLIEIYVGLEPYHSAAGLALRPTVGFIMPDSVHMERLDS